MDNLRRPQLSGRTVVVTGGTRGVGAGIAKAFVEAGAQVVVCARRPPEVPLDGVEFAPLDLRDPPAVRAFFAALPGLDVLVNNAGGGPYRLLADADAERHARVLELNLVAPLTASLAAYEHLRRAKGAVSWVKEDLMSARKNGAGRRTAHAGGRRRNQADGSRPHPELTGLTNTQATRLVSLAEKAVAERGLSRSRTCRPPLR